MKKSLLLFVLFISASYAQNGNDLVKFTAKIQNRNTDSLVIQGPSKFKKILHIDKKGVFSDSFSATTGLYQLTDGVEYTMLYFKNGYDLMLNMDAKQFDESIVFSGNGALENNYLAQKSLINEETEPKVFSAKNQSDVDSALADFTKRLNDKLNVKGMDPDFKSLASKLLNQETTGMMMEAKNAMASKKLLGTPSPQFNYENYAGGKTKLSDLIGKYVYIDVWATWCGPCRAEIPSLQKTEEMYKGKNIAFVSISIDKKSDYEKWRKMVGEKSLGGTQVFADNDWNSEFITAYGINSIPRFILIDPKGNVVNADAARPSDPALQGILEKLLK